MIITVCCEKGGVGKSALAQNLAVYLSVEQNIETLLIDADPQKTTADWIEDRDDAGLPKITCVEKTGNILKDLESLSTKYKVIIVDCGGADSKAMRSSLAIADIALIPFRPKRRDLKRAPTMGELIDDIKIHNPNLLVKSVLTQCPTLPSQTNRILKAKGLLDSLGLPPMNNFTCARNAWDDAEEGGSSVLEFGEDPKAENEAREVFTELLEGVKL